MEKFEHDLKAIVKNFVADNDADKTKANCTVRPIRSPAEQKNRQLSQRFAKLPLCASKVKLGHDYFCLQDVFCVDLHMKKSALERGKIRFL